MGIGVLVQEELFVMGSLVPVGAHHHPLARIDLSVLRLPSLDVFGSEQKVWVFGRLPGAVDHVDRRNEALDVERVGVAVLEVLARNPVMRRVEVGAGMLAQHHPVPGEERPVGIVFADLVDFDLGRVLGEVLRQAQDRRARIKGGGAIDDSHLAGHQHCAELAQEICGIHVGSFLRACRGKAGLAASQHRLGDVEDGVDGLCRGHVARRKADEGSAEIHCIALDPKRADHGGSLRLVRKAQHDRAAAHVGFARRMQRQVEIICTRDDPVDQTPIPGCHFGVILACVPLEGWQRGDRGHRSWRAAIEATDVGRILELVDVPGKWVVLRKPTSAVGLQFQCQ